MSYWKIKIIAGIALVLVIGVLLVSSVLVDGPSTTDTPEQENETSDDPYGDNAIIAAEMGLPREYVDKVIAQQESFSEYAVRLREMFPNQISGTWWGSPNGPNNLSTRLNIRFKGVVPPGVRSTDNVRIMGEGGLSYDEHNLRAREVEEILYKLGYSNYWIGYSPIDNKIRITMQISTDTSVPEPTVMDFLPAVNQHLKSVYQIRGAAATPLTADDIYLDVSRGEGSMVTYPIGP